MKGYIMEFISVFALIISLVKVTFIWLNYRNCKKSRNTEKQKNTDNDK